MSSKKGKRKQKKQRSTKNHRSDHGNRRSADFKKHEDVEEESSGYLCECCMTNPDIAAFCETCEGFICHECFDNHQPKKRYEDHHSNIVDKETDYSKIQVLGIATCPKHYLQQLDFFCLDCSQTACYHCTLTDHRSPDHNLKDLDDLADATKNLYKDLVSDIPSPAQIFCGVRERVKKVEQQFLNQTSDVKDTLYNRSKKMTATVRAKGRNLEAEVVALKKARSKALVPVKKAGEVDDDLRSHRAEVVSKLMIRINEMEFVTLRAGVAYGLERICLSTENATDLEKRLEQTWGDRQTSGSSWTANLKTQRSKRSKQNNASKNFYSKSASNVKLKSDAVSNESYINPLLKIVETHWEEQLKVGEVGEEEGQFRYARCVTVVQNGDIIVADDMRRRVYIFDNSGKYKTLFHPDQSYVGRPAYACSLALTSKNQVVVADLTIFIKVFTYDGSFLYQVNQNFSLIKGTNCLEKDM